MKVYIVLRCQQIVRVYKSKENAEKQVKKFVDSQEMYGIKDFEIKEEVVV